MKRDKRIQDFLKGRPESKLVGSQDAIIIAMVIAYGCFHEGVKTDVLSMVEAMEGATNVVGGAIAAALLSPEERGEKRKAAVKKLITLREKYFDKMMEAQKIAGNMQSDTLESGRVSAYSYAINELQAVICELRGDEGTGL